MSIYSSVHCPKCDKGELSLATAFGWNKIRFYCLECDDSFETEINETEENMIRMIIGRMK